MYTEARKLNLIEDVLKIKSETVLIELETIVKNAIKTKNNKKVSAHTFLQSISKEDSELMECAIEEGCEQINPDDWK